MAIPFWSRLTQIEAIDKELNRLHDILGEGDTRSNIDIWKQIKLLEQKLIDLKEGE